MARVLRYLWLGHRPYGPTLALQQRIVERRKAAKLGQDVHAPLPDLVLMIEHPPTFTGGRRTRGQDDAGEGARLRALGAEYHETARGGLTTYHGPGQLVAYPIVDLPRFLPGGAGTVQKYVHGLERALIATCAAYGVAAGTTLDTGVWLGDAKIAAIGVQVSFGISWHGVALNCAPDLAWFDHIVPCGLVGKRVTSLAAETKRDPRELAPEAVAPVLARELGRSFDVPVHACEPDVAHAVRQLYV